MDELIDHLHPQLKPGCDRQMGDIAANGSAARRLEGGLQLHVQRFNGQKWRLFSRPIFNPKSASDLSSRHDRLLVVPLLLLCRAGRQTGRQTASERATGQLLLSAAPGTNNGPD